MKNSRLNLLAYIGLFIFIADCQVKGLIVGGILNTISNILWPSSTEPPTILLTTSDPTTIIITDVLSLDTNSNSVTGRPKVNRFTLGTGDKSSSFTEQLVTLIFNKLKSYTTSGPTNTSSTDATVQPASTSSTITLYDTKNSTLISSARNMPTTSFLETSNQPSSSSRGVTSNMLYLGNTVLSSFTPSNDNNIINIPSSRTGFSVQSGSLSTTTKSSGSGINIVTETTSSVIKSSGSSIYPELTRNTATSSNVMTSSAGSTMHSSPSSTVTALRSDPNIQIKLSSTTANIFSSVQPESRANTIPSSIITKTELPSSPIVSFSPGISIQPRPSSPISSSYTGISTEPVKIGNPVSLHNTETHFQTSALTYPSLGTHVQSEINIGNITYFTTGAHVKTEPSRGDESSSKAIPNMLYKSTLGTWTSDRTSSHPVSPTSTARPFRIHSSVQTELSNRNVTSSTSVSRILPDITRTTFISSSADANIQPKLTSNSETSNTPDLSSEMYFDTGTIGIPVTSSKKGTSIQPISSSRVRASSTTNISTGHNLTLSTLISNSTKTSIKTNTSSAVVISSDSRINIPSETTRNYMTSSSAGNNNEFKLASSSLAAPSTTPTTTESVSYSSVATNMELDQTRKIMTKAFANILLGSTVPYSKDGQFTNNPTISSRKETSTELGTTNSPVNTATIQSGSNGKITSFTSNVSSTSVIYSSAERSKQLQLINSTMPYNKIGTIRKTTISSSTGIKMKSKLSNSSVPYYSTVTRIPSEPNSHLITPFSVKGIASTMHTDSSFTGVSIHKQLTDKSIQTESYTGTVTSGRRILPENPPISKFASLITWESKQSESSSNVPFTFSETNTKFRPSSMIHVHPETSSNITPPYSIWKNIDPESTQISKSFNTEPRLQPELPTSTVISSSANISKQPQSLSSIIVLSSSQANIHISAASIYSKTLSSMAPSSSTLTSIQPELPEITKSSSNTESITNPELTKSTLSSNAQISLKPKPTDGALVSLSVLLESYSNKEMYVSTVTSMTPELSSISMSPFGTGTNIHPSNKISIALGTQSSRSLIATPPKLNSNGISGQFVSASSAMTPFSLQTNIVSEIARSGMTKSITGHHIQTEPESSTMTITNAMVINQPESMNAALSSTESSSKKIASLPAKLTITTQQYYRTGISTHSGSSRSLLKTSNSNSAVESFSIGVSKQSKIDSSTARFSAPVTNNQLRSSTSATTFFNNGQNLQSASLTSTVTSSSSGVSNQPNSQSNEVTSNIGSSSQVNFYSTRNYSATVDRGINRQTAAASETNNSLLAWQIILISLAVGIATFALVGGTFLIIYCRKIQRGRNYYDVAGAFI